MTSRISAPTKLKVTEPSGATLTDSAFSGDGLTYTPVPATACPRAVTGPGFELSGSTGNAAIGAGACDGGSTSSVATPSVGSMGPQPLQPDSNKTTEKARPAAQVLMHSNGRPNTRRPLAPSPTKHTPSGQKHSPNLLLCGGH